MARHRPRPCPADHRRGIVCVGTELVETPGKTPGSARTDLPRLTLHGLRHTHATLLLQAGVPLKVVSERLGHSQPAFTMATYQHVLTGMQADAATTFATLLSSSNGL